MTCSTPTVTTLTQAEGYSVEICCTELCPDWEKLWELKWNVFSPLSTAWPSLNRFSRNSAHLINHIKEFLSKISWKSDKIFSHWHLMTDRQTDRLSEGHVIFRSPFRVFFNYVKSAWGSSDVTRRTNKPSVLSNHHPPDFVFEISLEVTSRHWAPRDAFAECRNNK